MAKEKSDAANDAAIAKALGGRKAKTRKGRKILQDREPKIVEAPKSALIIKGNKSSVDVKMLLTDLHRMRNPLSTLYSRPHPIHPFEDHSSLVRLCNKHDHSLFAFGSSSKKRPFRMIFGRLFNGDLLDMIEYKVSNYKSINSFETKGRDAVVGSKPLLIFQGAGFENDETMKRTKSLLLDYFGGPGPDKVVLEGLENVVIVTQHEAPSASVGADGIRRESASDGAAVAGDVPTVTVRRFAIEFQKSGSKLPRVELQEVGPSFSMAIDRVKDPDRDKWKMATKIPKGAKPKKVKNVSAETTGTKRARIHLGKQDFDQIHTVHHSKKKDKKLRAAVQPTKKAKTADATA
mmetsp:Transcript_28027/g.60857  ORF Transcript_28027/g.60857 Transcript_28027/m.60857 type:complete len:348 (-) Transcript_28027:83-1126(-)